jgi:hypothetical protein
VRVTGAVALPVAHDTAVTYRPRGSEALVCTVQLALPELFVLFAGVLMPEIGMVVVIVHLVKGAVCTRAVNVLPA